MAFAWSNSWVTLTEGFATVHMADVMTGKFMHVPYRFAGLFPIIAFTAATLHAADFPPAVDAMVRDGVSPYIRDGVPDTVVDGGVGVIQVVNVPNFEDRAILEFPLFAPVP